MSLVKFSDVVLTSSRGPILAKRIEFPSDWKSSGILDWYRTKVAGGRSTSTINTLQLRREKAEPFTHQYIVLILDGGHMLRLDRRGDQERPMNAVRIEGIESVDTIATVNSLSELDRTSYCLAELRCQINDIDLSNIIKICYGIHTDDKARRYTLQRFNCYFFSWTILVVTSRHAVPWDILPFDSPWQKLSETLADTLSTKFADALITMLADTASIIIMTIFLRLKPQLRKAMKVHGRIACAMPQSLVRVAVRLLILSSGRLRMHSHLRSKLHTALLSALQSALRTALEDLRASTLRTTLWQDGVGEAMREAARRDVLASILDAAAKALSSISIQNFQPVNADSISPAFLPARDRDFFEGQRGGWRKAFVAGFQATMQVTPAFAADGADGFVTDDAKWDESWKAVRDASREAAKNATKDEEHRGWAGVWEVLWVEWDAGWEASRCKTRETARRTARAMTKLVNDALADSVVDTLPGTNHLHFAVRNMVSPRYINRV